MGLQYKLSYKKGAENKAADALSRRPGTGDNELLAISLVQPVWFQEVMDGYMKHPSVSKLLAALTVQSPMGHFTLKDGLIRYKNRIWVEGNEEVQLKICQTFHSSATGGHSGFQVTYIKIKHLFACPKMKQFIQQYVAQCVICQQAKTERVKYPGLLQPLPVPDFAWQVVSLDFIEGLPKSKHYNCILVIVDKFFKYSSWITSLNFMGCPKP